MFRYATTLVLFIFVSSIISAQDIGAKTNDGRDVILKNDGTWKFEEKEFIKSDVLDIAQKKDKATDNIQNRFGNVNVWYDPQKWTSQKLNDGTAEYQFVAVSGESYARLVTEKMQLNNDIVRKAIESNARRVSKIFEVSEEKEIVVNNSKVNYLKARVNMQNIFFIFCFYYWTGENGTGQVFSYTSEALFDHAKSEMFELMNGLEIK